MGGVAVTRRRRDLRARPTLFADAPATVGELLGSLAPNVERVYLTGGRPGGTAAGLRAWAKPDELPPGWMPGEHFLGERNSSPTFSYRREHGRPLTIHRAASWFSETATAAECVTAWEALGELVVRVFRARPHDPPPVLMSTPGTTGLELWRYSLPRTRSYEPLGDELQDLIRASSGQGRTEVLPAGADLGDELPQLVLYDARFAYSARCSGLPAGEPLHDERPDFAGWAPARYRCTWTVPPTHDGPGLLGHQAEPGAWAYVREPGERASGWVGSRELRLALDLGWPVDIHERLVWPQHGARGPLDTWSRKLVELRNDGVQAMQLAGEIDGRTAELLRMAARSILLHTIGRFNGGGRTVDRSSRDMNDMPAGARAHRIDRQGVHHWTEVTAPAQPELCHPEWCAEVWSRARAALLWDERTRRGAVVPSDGYVVALKTDAVYLAYDPQWPDDGRNGTLRHVRTWPGPLPRPRDLAELERLKRGGSDVITAQG